MQADIASAKIKKAKTALVLSQPFFASLALRLTIKEDKTCDTMYTDGKTLGYNPQFVDGLTLDETKGVLCHEVMHCALMHMTRREQRGHKKWNVAADYAINGILVQSGLKLPQGALLDHAYNDMSTEQVYGMLPDEPQGNGNSSDPGNCGEVRDSTGETGNNPTQSELTQMENDWKIAAGQSAQLAKTQGQFPAGLARLVEDILQPLINWREVLRRFIDNTAKNDYSWLKPNRRFIHEGLYLPSLNSEQLPEIIIAVDTSGSIDDTLLDQFSSEISCILEDYKTSATVIYCDSEVNHVEHFASDDLPVKLNPVGGGGTDFRPVFNYIENEGIMPACLIYLTDLYGDFPESEPCYSVLWIATDSKTQVPFGEVVRLQ